MGRSATVIVASEIVSRGFAAVAITIVPLYLGDTRVGQLAIATARG